MQMRTNAAKISIYLTSLAVLFATTAACSSSTSGGVDAGTGNEGGGELADDAAALLDSGPVPDTASDARFSPTTPGGESCDSNAFPAAATTCTIPGQYQVTEETCTSNNPSCTAKPGATYVWTAQVTVSGLEVKMTDGNTRLVRYALDGECSGKSSSGRTLRFLPNGSFVAEYGSSCSTGDAQAGLIKGVRK